jgi:hypothetical protein
MPSASLLPVQGRYHSGAAASGRADAALMTRRTSLVLGTLPAAVACARRYACPPLDEESGRGLFLVSVLSMSWGWYPAGKVTWCELQVPAGHSPSGRS